MPGYEAFDAPERSEQMLTQQRRQTFESRINAAGDSDRPAQWADRGIVDVPVQDLPLPDGINSAADFQKVSPEDMADGFRKLQTMKPYIDDGRGNSSDYWHQVDQSYGVDYPDGYQKVYDAFYGDGAIRLNKDGDQYDIVNGRHRIAIAKELGVPSVPARVIEKQ